MIKAIRSVCSAFPVIALSFASACKAESIPLSEQHAFCLDKATENADWLIKTGLYSHHTTQKAYNSCMKNAEALIKKEQRERAESRRRFAEYEAFQKKKRAQQEKEKNERFDQLFKDF